MYSIDKSLKKNILPSIKPWAICLIILLLLTACSTKTAYNYLDWAIQWKIRSLAPLDKTQKQQTKLAAISFHDWHQSTQLHQYADYLSKLKQRLQKGPISVSEIQNNANKAQELIDQSITQAIPDIAKFLSSLNEDQAKELKKKFAEDRKEYIKEYVDISLKKQAQKRYKELKDYLTHWIGSLNKPQKQQLKQWSLELTAYESLNAAQQQAWENEFKQVMEKRNDDKALLTGLNRLMFYQPDVWDPKLKSALDYNQDLTYQLLSNFANNLTPKQKKKLFKKLDNYIQVFRELSEEKQN